MKKAAEPSNFPKTLKLISNNMIWTTDHIAKYYDHRGSPGKRASAEMKVWESWKLIEGKRRAIGESKVWRLTKKGREMFHVKHRPIPFTSAKLNHYLSITSVWQDLTSMGALKHWSIELREPFMMGSRKAVYSPDAFFVIQTSKGTRAYLLEVQDSPITSLRWGEKWSIASSFFESPEYKTSSLQIIPGKILSPPRIIALSSQQPDTIQSGSRLPLIISKEIKSAPI